MDSFDGVCIIHVPLEEDAEVTRPAESEYLEPGIFRILPCDNYNPKEEAWAFPPGSIVEVFEGEEAGHTARYAFTRIS